MGTVLKNGVIPLPVSPPAPKRKPRNMTSDGRRCVRVDAGYDPATGKRIRKAFYGKTLKEAQQKADEFRRAVADGIDVAAREQTVSQWVETWLEIYGRKGAPSTVVLHEHYALSLSKAIGDIKLCSVRPIHIQRFADTIKNHSQNTVELQRCIVQSIFRQAIHNRILTFDPTNGVSWGGSGKGTHRALTSEEISCLCDHWQEHPMGATVMLMLYSGMRRGEALGLRWDDVDMEANVIHIRNAMQVQKNHKIELSAPKTSSSVRDVPILPVARSVLESLPRSGPFVLPQFKSMGCFGYAFKKFVKHMQTYMPGFVLRTHDLRHTFTSLCYDAAVDVKTAQALLGHSTASITLNIYTHLSAERMSSSIEALATFTSERFGHQMGINEK